LIKGASSVTPLDEIKAGYSKPGFLLVVSIRDLGIQGFKNSGILEFRD